MSSLRPRHCRRQGEGNILTKFNGGLRQSPSKSNEFIKHIIQKRGWQLARRCNMVVSISQASSLASSLILNHDQNTTYIPIYPENIFSLNFQGNGMAIRIEHAKLWKQVLKKTYPTAVIGTRDFTK